jgi:hypothetical protein
MRVEAMIEGKIIMHDVVKFGEEHDLGFRRTKELIRDIAKVLQVPGWIVFRGVEDDGTIKEVK